MAIKVMIKRNKNAKDITGQKFNFLTAIKYVGRDKGTNSLWLFKCDCGNEKVIMLQNVTRNNVKSCGCYQLRYHKSIKFHGDPLQRIINKIFSHYKKRSNYKNIAFDLNIEQFAALIKQGCTYCGEVGVNGQSNLKYNGIDRVDNFLGYTADNSVPCCKYCNQMKSDTSLEKFIEKIELLHSRLTNKKRHLK